MNTVTIEVYEDDAELLWLVHESMARGDGMMRMATGEGPCCHERTIADTFKHVLFSHPFAVYKDAKRRGFPEEG